MHPTSTRLLALGAAIALLVSCGGSPVTPHEMPPPPTPNWSAINEPLLAGAVTDTMHGVAVADPYRALEDDSDATWAWVDAQNELTDAYLRRNDRPGRAERIEQLLSIGFMSGVEQAGGDVFFIKREGDAEQGSLFVSEQGTDAPRVLVNPNLEGEKVAIDWVFVSPRGTYVAYGLSQNGDERSTLHVVEVASGARLDEAIAHTKWTSLAWLQDESGFYYTRYPVEGEADYDGESEDTYNRHLFFHSLGADAAADPLVMRAPEPTDHLWVQVSDDDGWVSVTNWRSWSATDLWLIERAGDGSPVTISQGGDSVIYGNVRNGQLLLYWNEGHPLGRMLTASLDSLTDPAAWQELVPEGTGTIEDVYLTADRIVIHSVEDVTSKLRQYDYEGNDLGDIALPMRGSVRAVAADLTTNDVVFTFDSFFQPPTLYRYSPEVAGLIVLDQVQTDVDVSNYELDQVIVESQDGTPVNVYLVHRADMVPDGNQPVLLNGYGGFKSSMMPGFQRNVLYWLEQGGVFAVANIRGGGEYGEEWHRDGMLENKHHVFEDFEAVIRWLTTSGLSNPDRIALIGGSNGGLLMGAMMTRCPDAFRAAVSSVGLYDMVRFTEFPPAEIWIGEYGDPADADAFAYLHDYSPYHQVEDGTPYPAILIETADQDSRVSWRHSTKFAALLQDATNGPNPIVFYMSRDEGHGAGSGRTDIVDRYVRYYTFIETELDVY